MTIPRYAIMILYVKIAKTKIHVLYLRRRNTGGHLKIIYSDNGLFKLER